MSKVNFFEAAQLDDGTKEQLCRDLLAEFGVKHINANSRGELIHSCCLPFGKHKNGDRNPSASLNFKKLTYRCLGCGSGGGLLWFIACCRGEDGAQARKWLEKQTGTGNEIQDLGTLLKLLDAIFDPVQQEVQQIPQYSSSVLDPWTWDEFHPYLTEGIPEIGYEGRHIPRETLRHFRVGYAPEYKMGFLPDGTPRPTQERIVIPLWWRENLVGWQARAIRSEDAHPEKYKNSVEFPRDQVFYNWVPGPVVLVESPMSVLKHWHHQPNMVASFGAHLGEKQVALLRQAESVTLWMDNDPAGWESTAKLVEELDPYAMVSVVDSPYDADPADLDDDTVDTLIAEAVPWGIWEKPETLTSWEG
jgi:DNA primase